MKSYDYIYRVEVRIDTHAVRVVEHSDQTGREWWDKDIAHESMAAETGRCPGKNRHH